jgi:hypothetical protein
MIPILGRCEMVAVGGKTPERRPYPEYGRYAGANGRLLQGPHETWKFAATKAFESEANGVQDWLAQFRFQSLPSASS